MADVQAWANQIAQQLFDGPQDLANEAAANVTDASGLAFFVGKPNGSSGQWTLKKLTPTELGKLVYNYLTTQSIAQQLASVLGVLLCENSGGPKDLNSLNSRGIKLVASRTDSQHTWQDLHFPVQGNEILVLNLWRDNNVGFQIAMAYGSACLYYRRRWSETTYAEWQEIPHTPA